MSIIEDFASLNVELSKIEQAKMPTVQPDFSNSGDVTDEARKTFYGMFGYPTGGGIEDLQTCFAAAKGEKVNLKPLTIHVSPNTQEACRRSQKQIAESVSRAIKAGCRYYIGRAKIDGSEMPEAAGWVEVWRAAAELSGANL